MTRGSPLPGNIHVHARRYHDTAMLSLVRSEVYESVDLGHKKSARPVTIAWLTHANSVTLPPAGGYFTQTVF